MVVVAMPDQRTLAGRARLRLTGRVPRGRRTAIPALTRDRLRGRWLDRRQGRVAERERSLLDNDAQAIKDAIVLMGPAPVRERRRRRRLSNRVDRVSVV